MLPLTGWMAEGGWLPGLLYLLVGVGFGYVLEASGFGDSRRLAAQFYLREMRVLKVMFTAIVTAMSLLLLSSALGLLDTGRIFVNPTYLWPQIVGGLIMGVGFIIGGFCPGTSLVGTATLKGDALFFLLGVFSGIMAFSEGYPLVSDFYRSGYRGTFRLPDLLGVSDGWVGLGVVLMALGAFAFAGSMERRFGPALHESGDVAATRRKWQRMGASVLVALALLALLIGQPEGEERFVRMPGLEKALAGGAVSLHPAEVLDIMNDMMLRTRIWDIRPEASYNQMHLKGAERMSQGTCVDQEHLSLLLADDPQRVLVLVDRNGGEVVRSAYRQLRGRGVMNVYYLEGGMEGWWRFFPPEAEHASQLEDGTWRFHLSVGDGDRSANPRLADEKAGLDIPFTRKLALQKRKVLSGGCG